VWGGVPVAGQYSRLHAVVNLGGDEEGVDDGGTVTEFQGASVRLRQESLQPHHNLQAQVRAQFEYLLLPPISARTAASPRNLQGARQGMDPLFIMHGALNGMVS